MSTELPAGFTLDNVEPAQASAPAPVQMAELPPGFSVDREIAPTEEGVGQMMAEAPQSIQKVMPVAGLPVPGYPGQFSSGAPNPEKPNALMHIGSAVGSAFAGPYGPSDDSMGALVNGPSPVMNSVNRLLVGGGGAVLDAMSRPIVAGARGLGAIASEGYQALGGGSGDAARLERDISQAPEALLPLSVPAPNYMKAAPITAAERYPAIANKLDYQIANDVQGPGRGQYLLNQLTSAINAADEPVSTPRNALLPPEAPPAARIATPTPPTSDALPSPSAAGAAATPGELANMTPREQAVQQARAENLRLAEPVKEGVDKTEYVPGVKPTAAEVAGNASVSGEQKYIAQTPGQEQRFAAQQRANNDARIEHYDNLAGDAVIVDRLREARSEQAQKDLDAAWQNKAEADPTSVVEHIDATLKGPSGKESAVSSALTKVRDLLYDADGKLETDPEVLYGARKEVASMLGKAAQQEKPTLRDAARQLQDVKDQLDSAIEQGAPGYKQYLANFSEASRPIDVHELLQSARPGLTNGSQRQMTFGTMDRLMRNIVADRQKSGTNPAKSIDPATMEGLWNLHSDLKRLNNIDLGKPRGSDTSAMGRMGGALGLTAAHGVAGTVLPFGVGNLLVQQGHSALMRGRLEKRVNKLLDGTNYK